MCLLASPVHAVPSVRLTLPPNTERIIEDGINQLPVDQARIVILSSVPDLGAHYRRKRQISDSEWEAIESASTQENDIGVTLPGQAGSSVTAEGVELDSAASDRKPVSVFAPSTNANINVKPGNGNGNGNGNGTTVDPHAGLLFRYSFTSPYLIFGTLVVLLVLLPALLIAIKAITSIELARGLEQGKMIGGQLGESKKDQ